MPEITSPPLPPHCRIDPRSCRRRWAPTCRGRSAAFSGWRASNCSVKGVVTPEPLPLSTAELLRA
eukprot:430823-Prymnesium_polylepis.1